MCLSGQRLAVMSRQLDWYASCTTIARCRVKHVPTCGMQLAVDTEGEGIRVRKITIAVLAWIAVCAFGGPGVVAQTATSEAAAAPDSTAGELTDEQLALLRKDIRSSKKQLIAANLTLTDTEATKFWPVYEQYSADFGKINEARSIILKEYSDGYGTLTDDQADGLIRRWLDTDISAAQLRQKCVPIMRKVLSGKKAATFFQLDRRISMMIDVQLTSQLPLVQSQD
jgi:hypothetical protein